MHPTPRVLALLLVLLQGCTSQNPSARLAEGHPGLDIAAVAMANGVPETALRIAQAALRRNPADADALTTQATAQLALGRGAEAADSFLQALAVSPGNRAAGMGLGRLRLASDPAAARAIFARLTAADPGDAKALTDLGIAEDFLGDHAAAQASYREALRRDATVAATRADLGLSLALSGHGQEALGVLRPLAADPAASVRVRDDLALALAVAGNRSDAAHALDGHLSAAETETALASYEALRPMP